MPRVTAEDVQSIFPSTLNLEPFIFAASTLVDLYFATSGYGVQQLCEIERFWAAHLASAPDPRVTSKTLGNTKIDYQTRKPATGLQSTSYGETVLLLDTENIIAAAQAQQEQAAAEAVKYATFAID
jgi:hypothetical protein